MKKIALIVAACLGLFAAPAPASILGLELTVVDFSNGYVMADGSILPGTEFIGPAWQKAGVTTYRVWVHVDSVLETISMVGHGGDCLPLVLHSTNFLFINSTPFGSDTPPNSGLFKFIPNLAWDSFVTIGGATAQTVPNGFLLVDPLNHLGGLTGSFISRSARWLLISPPLGAGVVSDGAGGWRILIAQLTVPHGEYINGLFYIQSPSGQFMYDSIFLEGPPNLCPADLAPPCGDGMVDVADIVAVLDQFGPCFHCQEDIAPSPGGNNVVNIDDLVALLNNFGPCS